MFNLFKRKTNLQNQIDKHESKLLSLKQNLDALTNNVEHDIKNQITVLYNYLEINHPVMLNGKSWFFNTEEEQRAWYRERDKRNQVG